MLWFKKKKLERRQINKHSSWYKDEQGFDVVAFVHGILGNNITTWGEFPQLLDTDPDLPLLDILLWGYKTGLVPSSYQDIKTEGEALMGALERMARLDREVYLVGHSMGGLVILKGLVVRILAEQGQQSPVEHVRCIVLYATPLFGSAFADIAAVALKSHPYVRWATIGQPKKQLEDLRKGTFCEELTAEVVRLIHSPKPESLLMRRSIPVRACVGKQDPIVTASSAKGVFTNPAPTLLEGDHGSCKHPDHHGDERYLALKHDIEKHLTQSFGTLCAQALTAADINDRALAAKRIDAQYGAMIRRTAVLCFPGKEVTEVGLRDVALLTWELGAKCADTPARVMSRVVADFWLHGGPRIRPKA